MKFVTGVNDFGYCPENVHLAHDDLARALWSKKQLEDEREFEIAVGKYKHLETPKLKNENDKNEENNKMFFVRCPRNLVDLQKEGRIQNNCVAGYASWIIAGRSKVLFMRSYLEPEQSLVTIEVQGKRLVQAKASHNRVANNKCQKFICEWCEEHEIIYRTCRDITIKVS